MNKGLYIAGTDTGIGKTLVTGLLADCFSKKGINVVTQKWVQTGTDDGPDDVTTHLSLMGRARESYSRWLNVMVPYSFKLPASPHLASSCEGRRISIKRIRESYFSLTKDFDLVLVEGTGGVLVPLTLGKMSLDLVKTLDLDVLLVAGNRLGCINHSLLTLEALSSRGINAAGIIFNRFCPEGDESVLQDNKSVISRFSGIEVLGELPYEKDPVNREYLFDPIADKVISMFLPDLSNAQGISA